MQKEKKEFKLICKVCNKEFIWHDKRMACCSGKCRYQARAKIMLEKYGYDNPARKQRTVEEKAIISKKLSDTSVFKTDRATEVKKKRQDTLIKKYGTKCAFANRDTSKIHKTLEDRYGTRSSRIAKELILLGFNRYEDFCLQIINYFENNNIAPYSDQAKDYIKNTYNLSYEIINDVLEFSEKQHLLYTQKSSIENELSLFLDSLNLKPDQILRNRRPTFMQGKELDFYLPDFKLAIELHGLAFHSERPIYKTKDLTEVKTIHEQKYLNCKKEGIRLIQIFEDEWLNKKDLIKEMITNRLSLSSNKIFARLCEYKELTQGEEVVFFKENHISGNTHSFKAFGLFYKDKLVSALSIRKTWHKAYGDNIIEIARFASLKGYNILGGFQKLLKQVEIYCKEVKLDGILTYADCRFGSGNVYLTSGFEYLGKTNPNYFYEKDGIREQRFKHRKDVTLVGATEREQQNLLGWYAIYDAGSEIYFKLLKGDSL